MTASFQFSKASRSSQKLREVQLQREQMG